MMTTGDKALRVIVVAEHTEVRNLLSRVAEHGDGVSIVGEAPDATKALFLAKELKPDVVVLDSYLPHAVGLDAVPLSRIGGLDAAQTIAEELPAMTVVLVNNLDEEVLANRGLSVDSPAILTSVGSPGGVPLVLRSLHEDTARPKKIVFAGVHTRPWEVLEQKRGSLADKLVFFGGLGIAVGLSLIIMFLGPVGIYVVSVGAAAVLVGLGWKLIARFGRRVRGQNGRAGGE